MKRDWNPDEPEWMDRPQPVNAALEGDLADLGALNRRFGGHALIARFLERWFTIARPAAQPYRILDLCTGYGDIPRMMVDWARPRGIPLAIDALDFQPATLEIARRQSTAYPEIRYLQGDALTFAPPSAEPYHLAHCSLALHHFSTADAADLLRRCRLLSPRRVLITDLERNRLAQLAIWLITATVYRAPMMRHDARLSVRRAFSGREFKGLAQAAGWGPFSYERYFPCRQAIWLE